MGRRPIDDNERSQVSVYLTEENIQYLDSLPAPTNRSQFLNALLDAYREQQKVT